MVRLLALIEFTERGIREVHESVRRAKAFSDRVTAAGGKMIAQYWVIGPQDGAIIFECPDDVTAARLLIELAREGCVKTHSMRLLTAEEFGTAAATK